jgi:hypothetical protein
MFVSTYRPKFLGTHANIRVGFALSVSFGISLNEHLDGLAFFGMYVARLISEDEMVFIRWLYEQSVSCSSKSSTELFHYDRQPAIRSDCTGMVYLHKSSSVSHCSLKKSELSTHICDEVVAILFLILCAYIPVDVDAAVRAY